MIIFALGLQHLLRTLVIALITDYLTSNLIINPTTMKQIIQLTLLALAILLPTTTAAKIKVDGIYYIINGNEASVTNTGFLNNYSGDIVIPETITYEGTTYTVTAIGTDAFSYSPGLTSVHMPNTVKKIGDYAFWYAKAMTTVNISDSVTSIGRMAFDSCPLLESVHIPSAVTFIGQWGFMGCTGLTSITVAEDNPKFDSREDCNAIIETASNKLIAGCRNTVIPSSVTYIGDAAFYNCAELMSVTLPEGLTTIGNGAFRNCIGLSEVTFPESLKTIYNSSFMGCSGISTLHIPKYVNRIDNWAFAECSGLTSITVASENYHFDSRDNCNAIIDSYRDELIVGCQNTVIPNTVDSINGEAFYRCTGLRSIHIPSSIKAIAHDAFYGCSNLTAITVAEENPVFDSRENCNAIIETEGNVLHTGIITTVIPSTVTAIGNYAFNGLTELTGIDIPISVTSIGDYAFSGCTELADINIPDSVTYVGGWAFYECPNLTKMSIPNGVSSIEPSIFSQCTGLTEVTFGNAVTQVGRDVFSGCNNLVKLTCKTLIPPSVEIYTLDYPITRNATLYVPRVSLEAYQTADQWEHFDTILPIENDINGDGGVSISDVTSLIDLLLSGGDLQDYISTADVNGDGNITISDVTALIDQLLSGDN